MGIRADQAPGLGSAWQDAEIVSMQRAWFRCPHCQRDWKVRIADDRVTVLPV